jgi:hypothetical protein
MDAAHPNQVLFSDKAFNEYIGQGGERYSGIPFSREAPAVFKGPFDILAKHDLFLRVYVMYPENAADWVRLPPYPRGEIRGRIARTQFIVDRLGELSRLDQGGPHTIYEQGAFSTFGICDNPAERRIFQAEEAYYPLVLQQRKLLNELAHLPGTTLKIIISPNPNYPSPVLRQRFDELLKWMKDDDILKHPNIDWAMMKYDGPNRLIVLEHFLI